LIPLKHRRHCKWLGSRNAKVRAIPGQIGDIHAGGGEGFVGPALSPAP
jgi:hypothetical protein